MYKYFKKKNFVSKYGVKNIDCYYKKKKKKIIVMKNRKINFFIFRYESLGIPTILLYHIVIINRLIIIIIF